MCIAADNVLHNKLDRTLWTAEDYKTVLKPLKTRADGKMPTALPDLKKCFQEWIYRPRRVFDVEDSVEVKGTEGNEDDNDNDEDEEVVETQVTV